MTTHREILKNHFFEALKELSNRSLQERIWTNTDNPIGLVRSYTEASIRLFDDALVTFALEEGTIIYDEKVTEALRELSDAINNVNEDNRYAIEVINDPKMEIVRSKAQEILALIEASDKSENTAVFIEEGTLRVLEP